MALVSTLKGGTLKGRTLILGAPAGGLEPAVLPMSAATGDVNAAVTGISLTLSIGNESVTADASTSVTGQSGTLSLGTATVALPVDVAVTGNPLSISTGSVGFTASASPPVTGVSMSLLLGNEQASGDASVIVTGQQFGIQVYSPVVTADGQASVNGNALASILGAVATEMAVDVPAASQTATIALGSVSVIAEGGVADVSVNVTGTPMQSTVSGVAVTTGEAAAEHWVGGGGWIRPEQLPLFEPPAKDATATVRGMAIRAACGKISVEASKEKATAKIIPITRNARVEVRGSAIRAASVPVNYKTSPPVVIDHELEEFVLMVANM